MANSKYEYVRQFEKKDTLLPNTWIVVRIDGRSFHKLAAFYEFTKPNDGRALNLMNDTAVKVFDAVPDICVAYGYSDEYSFVLKKNTTFFERRSSKLVTTIVSTFTASYVHLWPNHFPSSPLRSSHLPTFDGRAVTYPSLRNVRDYLSWRQADCHINNLYNTTFWALVLRGGVSNAEAERQLAGTVAADKNELLFARFSVNYNNERQIYRKGSIVYRSSTAADLAVAQSSKLELATPKAEFKADKQSANLDSEDDADDRDTGFQTAVSKTQKEKKQKQRSKTSVVVDSVDIIGDSFWKQNPWVLER